jgi:hypothetical protein
MRLFGRMPDLMKARCWSAIIVICGALKRRCLSGAVVEKFCQVQCNAVKLTGISRQHQSLCRILCLYTRCEVAFPVEEDRQKILQSMQLCLFQHAPKDLHYATKGLRCLTSGTLSDDETDEHVRKVDDKSHVDPLCCSLICSGSRSRRSCLETRASQIRKHYMTRFSSTDSCLTLIKTSGIFPWSCHPPGIRVSTTERTRQDMIE